MDDDNQGLSPKPEWQMKRRRNDLAPKPESPALEGGEGLRQILTEFYEQVYADPRLSEVPAPSSPGSSMVPPHPTSIPAAGSVPEGCFWPPVRGRAILLQINERGTEKVSQVVPWAPAHSHEYRCHDLWLLHTREQWTHQSLDDARTALIRTVRDYSSGGRRIPDGRTLFIAEDQGLWRQWMISPILETLESRLRRWIHAEDRDGIVAALEDSMRAVSGYSVPASNNEHFPGLMHVAVHEGTTLDLRLPGTRSAFPQTPLGPTAELRELVTKLVAGDPAATACFYEAVAIMKERQGVVP